MMGLAVAAHNRYLRSHSMGTTTYVPAHALLCIFVLKIVEVPIPG